MRNRAAIYSDSVRISIWIALCLSLYPCLLASESAGFGLAGSLAPSAFRITDPPIVRGIIVETMNVFSDSLAEKVWVFRLMNKFHTRTREHVIKRELLLKPGDRYDADLAYETERTLRNLPFIYDAEVTLDSTLPDSVRIRVRTIDKFSLSGGAQVARQPGRSRVEIGARETNFLGLGHEINLKYNFVGPDPDYFVGSYSNPRAFGTFHRLALEYNNNPFDRVRSAGFSRPFIHQRDRFAYGMSVSDFRNRELKFNDGDTTLTFFQEGARVNLDGSYRFGDFHDKWVASAGYSYVNLRPPNVTAFAPYAFNPAGELVDSRNNQTLSVSLPADSAFHFVGGAVRYDLFDFERTSRINLQGRTEDIVLSSGGSVFVGQARSLSVGNLVYNTWRTRVFGGLRAGNMFVSGQLSRQGWISSGAEIRSSANAILTVFHNGLHWMTFASRLVFLSDKRIDQLDPLSLDESNGIRGYRENTLTGDRALIGNFETRFFSGVDILTTRIGGALNFDFGGAWDRDRKLRLDEMIWSAGAGLRLDLGQAGAGRVLRVDLTYVGRQNNWQISTGVGQYFSLFRP